MKKPLERLRDLRRDYNLTQEELGFLLSTGPRAISYYECGTRDIPTDVLIRCAALFRTSTDYILELTDDYTPYSCSETKAILLQRYLLDLEGIFSKEKLSMELLQNVKDVMNL